MAMADSEFEGKRAVVMGLGRFGGGAGVARWLCERGADVLITDLSAPGDLEEPVASLADLAASGRLTYRLGEHNVSDFTSADLVVANPAVPTPWDNRFLRAAQAAGVAITTEIRLAVERLPASARVVGVTGSAGKSTTSAMTAHVLRTLTGSCAFGGNIGGSLLTELSGPLRDARLIVLELSSAMLYWLAGWSPHVAGVTNFAPNHIDWHGSLDHYRESKRAILAHQRPGDAAILGPAVSDWVSPPGVVRRVLREDERVAGLHVPGQHNARNAAMAVALARAAAPELSAAACEEAVRSFPGLPHRLQFVGTRAVGAGRVSGYNDSKSTTPDSTLLALDAFREHPGLGRVRLIAGGYDKGSDLAPVAAAARDLARLYTIGVTGPRLADSARAAGARVTESADLDRAVASALADAAAGDVVLLSPACASWDQFTNYEARGQRFVDLFLGNP